MITSRDGRAWLINIWADATPPTVGPKSKIPPKIKFENLVKLTDHTYATQQFDRF